MKRILAVVGVLVLCFALIGCANEAKDAFNDAAKGLEEKNAELNEAIDSLQAVITSGESPLETEVLEAAETTATTSKAAIQEVPEMPSGDDAIKAATEEMNAVDYSKQLADIEEKKTALETSIKQMTQLTNPSEAFVVQRLEEIESITGIGAATEDNDPNNQLGKQGGYTASVYFSSSLVNQDEVFGEGIVGKGTDGGGCIEVYRSAEDAESRSTYLGAFDGSILATGSHEVLGTVLIRTSNKLTASQQVDLTAEIAEKLKELR